MTQANFIHKCELNFKSHFEPPGLKYYFEEGCLLPFNEQL